MTLSSEFSRIFDLNFPATVHGVHKITATEAERLLLTKRLGIKELQELTAEFTFLEDHIPQTFEVTGKLYSKLTQACVTTRDLVDESIEEHLYIKIKIEKDENPDDEDFDLDAEDMEFAPDAKVDMGELVVQYLAIAMNPYPRKEGVATTSLGTDEKTPFSALEKLRTEN